VKTVRLLFILFLFSRIALGQGDDCLSATYLPNTSNFCSPNGAFSNVGSTTSLLSLPTCWTTATTQDVWFQFIATGTDVLISVNGNGSGGTMIAPNVALYNGSCTGLMYELGCSPNTIGIGSTQLYEGALAPGTVYFIRVSSNPINQGTFSLCINCYTPSTNPGADCGGAAYLCNQNPVSVASLGGGGLDNDEPESGTCLDVWGPDEGNSSWFKWTCETSGTLTFDITPINPNDDIDFILYQLSSINACGPRTPIRCNSSSCLNSVGSTGLNLVDLDFDEWPNCDPGENAYCQYINMVAGVSYAILINNFSASTGFTISFNVGNTNNPGTFLGPHPILNSSNTTICQGSSVSYNANGSTNTAGGLSWVFSNGANSSQGTGLGPITINYANAGNFLGILNGFDQYGCQATQYVNIQVIEPPVLINPPSKNICSASSTGITLMNVVPSGTSIQWTVSQNPSIIGASNGSGSSINQFLVNTSNQIQTLTYSITATKGPCTVTSTVLVTILPISSPTFNNVNPICQGANLTALPTTSLNNITGSWSPALNNQATTTYTFTPTSGQCANTTTLSIAVNPTVSPSFNPVGPICQGANLTALPTTSLNNITGTWSSALNNQATTTYTFTPTSGQCANTATLSITVNPTVSPSFNPVGPICQGATLTALTTTSLNGITGSWSPALNNQATTTYTFTPASGQCANTTTLSITVNPTVSPSFNPVGPICQGANLTALPTTSLNNITGSWSPALNNQATTTYTFTPASGQCANTTTLSITVNPTVSPSFNPVGPICQGANLTALPTTSLNNITGTWAPALNNQATSTYTFTPTSGQCANTATLSIAVNPTVSPSFNPVGPICQGDNLTALPTTSLNNITGTWSPALNNQATTTYTFTPSSGQCASIFNQQLTVFDVPIAQFSVIPMDSILIGNTLYFHNGSQSATEYIWQMNGETFSSLQNPSYLTTNETQLNVTLIAINQGCLDTFGLSLPIIENTFLYVANCFTPDADEFNPTWKPILGDGFDLSSYYLLIFNRWGEVIWESNDAFAEWDGTLGDQGLDVPDGVYTWSLKIKTKQNDKNLNLTGSVLVIR